MKKEPKHVPTVDIEHLFPFLLEHKTSQTVTNFLDAITEIENPDTRSKLIGWLSNAHEIIPRGYARESDPVLHNLGPLVAEPYIAFIRNFAWCLKSYWEITDLRSQMFPWLDAQFGSVPVHTECTCSELEIGSESLECPFCQLVHFKERHCGRTLIQELETEIDSLLDALWRSDGKELKTGILSLVEKLRMGYTLSCEESDGRTTFHMTPPPDSPLPGHCAYSTQDPKGHISVGFFALLNFLANAPSGHHHSTF